MATLKSTVVFLTLTSHLLGKGLIHAKISAKYIPGVQVSKPASGCCQDIPVPPSSSPTVGLEHLSSTPSHLYANAYASPISGNIP